MIEYVCGVCGKTFMRERTEKYCSAECRAIKKRQYAQEYKAQHKPVIKVEIPLEQRIKHQKDKEIWCSNYAEKQKAQTLAMLGRIER